MDYNYDVSESTGNYAFLFNLDTMKTFQMKLFCHAYTINYKKQSIVFGNEDLVINYNLIDGEESYSKFPEAYGHKNNTLEDLTGGEEYFKFKRFEVLSKTTFV